MNFAKIKFILLFLITGFVFADHDFLQSLQRPTTSGWSNYQCIKCHIDERVEGVGKLSQYLLNLAEWQRQLNANNFEAKQLFNKTRSSVVDQKRMPKGAKNKEAFLKSADGKALLNFLKSNGKDLPSTVPGFTTHTFNPNVLAPNTNVLQPNSNALISGLNNLDSMGSANRTPAAVPIMAHTNPSTGTAQDFRPPSQFSVRQILSQGTINRYLGMLPKVESPMLAKAFSSPDTFYYNSTVMPGCYQDPTGFIFGVAPNNSNIGRGKGLVSRRGKIIYPFGTTAGTDNAPNLRKFQFMQLPRVNGKLMKVAYYTRRMRGESHVYHVLYPEGTVVGEVLYQKGPDGRDYAMEIRTSVKLSGKWVRDIHRPFPTSEVLKTRVAELRPNWRSDSSLSALMTSLDRKDHLRNETVQNGEIKKVHLSGARDVIPHINTAFSAELLRTTPFKSALGQAWKTNGNQVSYAPTTSQDFSIVPKGFSAHSVATDSKSCNQCHQFTNVPFRKLASSAFRRKDWDAYGNNWGSDGIFTFSIFDPRMLSKFAREDGGRHASTSDNRKIRGDISGLLMRYDNVKGAEKDYYKISTPYEVSRSKYKLQ